MPQITQNTLSVLNNARSPLVSLVSNNDTGPPSMLDLRKSRLIPPKNLPLEFSYFTNLRGCRIPRRFLAFGTKALWKNNPYVFALLSHKGLTGFTWCYKNVQTFSEEQRYSMCIQLIRFLQRLSVNELDSWHIMYFPTFLEELIPLFELH